MARHVPTPEQYEDQVSQLVDQRMAARRAALINRDEQTMREVADEMLEFCLETRQFRELLAVAPVESQAVVGKRFSNLLEQVLATEANAWATREITLQGAQRRASADEQRVELAAWHRAAA